MSVADWQPIETAPKNGMRILLGGKLKVGSGHFWDNKSKQHPRKRWVWDGYPKIEPTHWMPLPSPPRKTLAAVDDHEHQPMQHWCPECGPL